MGVDNLRIDFDGRTPVFIPGQTITGRVRFSTSGCVKIRGVKLEFKGAARTSWYEHYGRIGVEYCADEEYFAKELTLVHGRRKTRLFKDGEHVYPFNFSLPHQLPSSFNEYNGRVRYTANVQIDIPWGINVKTKIIFGVFSPINLNHIPLLAEPKIEERLKCYGYSFSESGSLEMIASVPYTGFVPGQSIPLTLELNNKSKVAIHAVQIVLEKIVTLKAKKPEKKTISQSSVLDVFFLRGILHACGSKTWTERITIPHNLVVANLKYCGIIVETYVLKVEAKAAGIHTNTSVNMQITIGHIPLTIAQDGF